MFDDLFSRIIKAERWKKALQDVHRHAGRGDDHKTPEMTANCVISRLVDLKCDLDEVEDMFERGSQKIVGPLLDAMDELTDHGLYDINDLEKEVNSRDKVVDLATKFCKNPSKKKLCKLDKAVKKMKKISKRIQNEYLDE